MPARQWMERGPSIVPMPETGRPNGRMDPDGHPVHDVNSSSRTLTLHGKVDITEEASLPWGVRDVQEEKSKTIHG